MIRQRATPDHPAPPGGDTYARRRNSTVAKLELLQVVRVRALLRDPTRYDDFDVNRRPPAVGDVGAITDIFLSASGEVARYVVECVDADGCTVWLTDFAPEEIEET